MNIVVISGSMRENRISHRVALHLVAKLAREENINVQLADVKEWNLPVVQSTWRSPADVPPEYKKLGEMIFSADGFIFVSPEYNGGYSPALKNLMDHFPKQSHKAFGIATSSDGAFGGIRASLALQHLVYALFGIGSPSMLIVPQVEKKFDEKGNLLDPAMESKVQAFLTEFLWLAGKIST